MLKPPWKAFESANRFVKIMVAVIIQAHLCHDVERSLWRLLPPKSSYPAPLY